VTTVPTSQLVPQELNLGPLAPHDIVEVIAGVLVIFVLWFIFAKFVSPLFESLYEKRTAEIEGGIMRAEKAQAEVEQLRKEYTAQLNEAKDEAARIREDARSQAAQLSAQLKEEATKESNRLLESARVQIEAERNQAETKLKTEVGGLATTLAGRIVGESLDSDDAAKRTVDRFLDELAGAAPKGGAGAGNG
jgi:F-type H+-transporting ATPase subunit b